MINNIKDQIQLNKISFYPLSLLPIHRSISLSYYFSKSTVNSCAPFKVISILCQGSRRNYRSREIHVKMWLYQSPCTHNSDPLEVLIKIQIQTQPNRRGICKTRRYRNFLLQVDFVRGLNICTHSFQKTHRINYLKKKST